MIMVYARSARTRARSWQETDAVWPRSDAACTVFGMDICRLLIRAAHALTGHDYRCGYCRSDSHDRSECRKLTELHARAQREADRARREAGPNTSYRATQIERALTDLERSMAVYGD